MAPAALITSSDTVAMDSSQSSIPNGFRRPSRQLSEHTLIAEDHHAHDASIIPYTDDLERLNSTMQLAWRDAMDDAYYSSSQSYDHVEVLMLSWEKESDDLQVQQEIDQLTEVFEKDFNYHVTRETIKRREKKRAQTSINAIVASWVDKYDDLKTLLLVYFAGHGKPGNSTGELVLNGYNARPTDVRNYLNSVIWNNTESNLRDIESDVLQIFDCCYAGTLGTRGGSGQAFEYLAATGADDTTPRPGPSSFTSALIWALKEFVRDGGRFTTGHLSEKILKAPGFPKGQKPVLSRRQETERIVLHPLSAAGTPPATLNSNGTIRNDTPGQDVVTLKFIFETRPSVQDIKNLGKDLNNVVHSNQLHVHRIMWGGIHPRENDAVFRAISRFQKPLQWRHSLPSIVSNGVPHFPSRAGALAAQFVEKVQEEVEEHVHEQVHEQVHEEFERERRKEFEEHAATQRLIKRGTDASLLESLEE